MNSRRVVPLLVAGLCACASDPAGALIIEAGALLDGAGALRNRARVVVSDGEITRVEDNPGQVSSSADADVVIEAANGLLMPGLFATAWVWEDDARCALTPERLKALGRAGFTTVALVAPPSPAVQALRAYVGTGRHRGPRVVWGALLSKAPGTTPMGQERLRALVTAAISRGPDWVAVSTRDAWTESELSIAAREVHRLEHRLLLVGAAGSAPSLSGVDGALPALPCDPGRIADAAWTDATPAALHGLLESSARLLDLHDALGKVAVGFRGDLLVVEGLSRGTPGHRAITHVIIDGVPQALGAYGAADRVAFAYHTLSAWLIY